MGGKFFWKTFFSGPRKSGSHLNMYGHGLWIVQTDNREEEKFGAHIFFYQTFCFKSQKLPNPSYSGSGLNQKGHSVLVFLFLIFWIKTDNIVYSAWLGP